MISKEAQEWKERLRQAYVPLREWRGADYAAMREAARKMASGIGPIPDGVIWKKDVIGGVGVERIFVENADNPVILHVHGGSMVKGDSAQGRFMLAHLALLTKRNTVSVDYRLCPEYAQPAAVEECAAVSSEDMILEY